MHRAWLRFHQCYRRLYPQLHRNFCSPPRKESNRTSESLRNSRQVAHPNPIILSNSSITTSNSFIRRSSFPVLALSATALSLGITTYYYSTSDQLRDAVKDGRIWANESFTKVFHHAKQTSAAASVLWQSLRSVLTSANHEVRLGFELRVASLLADIAAANGARRSALVGAGGGKVVDWLLDTVASEPRGKDGRITQSEAARALAYLIADPNVVANVLSRPHAVPSLLRFIFSCQPKKKKFRRSSFDVSDSLKGRSMLVAAILDVVTGNCDSIEKFSAKPLLSKVAETRDIAEAIEVIEEGGLHIDKPTDGEDDEDDDGGGGLKGIGIKILEGTTAISLARTGKLMNGEPNDDAKNFTLFNKSETSLAQKGLSSAIVPGLWDDLHCQHVAVPFAAWALANWAMASEINRSRIHELDGDGNAVTAALTAPERSVKWHGSMLACLMLEDDNLNVTKSVSDWSFNLLNTITLATHSDDVSLAKAAFPAFLLSLERSGEARAVVVDKGLEKMREIAKKTANHTEVQEGLAKALSLVVLNEETRLPLIESQKWGGTLLQWVFRKNSSDDLRCLAIKILDSTLDDYGPACVPISQAWLSMLLHDVLNHIKASSASSNPNQKTDKNQVDMSNVTYATQACVQLAAASVNLGNDSSGFPLTDLYHLEPLSVPFRNSKKDSAPKSDVADSAVATLKGIKALSEISADDVVFQEKITKLGVFVLLRRYLLNDDYEKLAAIKAYDQSQTTAIDNEASSSVRLPPTSHLRKHAARLMLVVSGQSEVQNAVSEDLTLHRWLEDCAGGKIGGCSDPKLQSYCRAILLNSKSEANSPKFHDAVLLINPDRPHWRNLNVSGHGFDVVFVHGLRGGPYKSWRLAEDKTTSGLVEKIDEESGKNGSFWPAEWLSEDFPDARLFTLKYKTNLTQWSGATLPLQEVSSKLLNDIVDAGIGERPVVFITHSMGGLVVKQMLHNAKEMEMNNLVDNTVGVVFYSCPHFGSKLADMPWRMGLVLRPAPTIGELRSGSPRLIELNNLIRRLNKKGVLDVLSFCETKVTPIVEGYGGWAVRMEIVPIESAYPGYGELVVLESTDHINSCKPVNRSDPSYAETLQFLRKLKERYS